MYYEEWNKDEFNGYLHSLRYICNTKSLEEFSIMNDCDFNRVQKLYNSNLHGSNYVVPILWAEDFNNELLKLIQKNKSKFHKKQKAEENNKILINQLRQATLNYCGIGLKEVEFILHRLSKTNVNARVIKMAVDIEIFSILAKYNNDSYSRYKYKQKEDILERLIMICDDNNINYGFKESDISSLKSIVLFDLPCGQVSWHSKIEIDPNKMYTQEWDNEECSTLNKLEKFIQNNFINENEKICLHL